MTEQETIKNMTDVIQEGCTSEQRCMDCDCYEMTLSLKGKCKEHYVAKRLFDKGCRIIADDEVIIKKSEYEALLLEQKRLKEIVDRIPCGYVKLADDEIAIKKREYQELKEKAKAYDTLPYMKQNWGGLM